MEKVTLLAIDLSKNYFQLHGLNKQGRCVLKKKVKRDKFCETLCNMPSCLVVMESCGSAHYWGRVFTEQGHDVKLIAPHYVKPYLKGHKNDANDAEAIAEAASRPDMRFSRMKTRDQQDIQSLHRMREHAVQARTALSNHIRGLLMEYGIVIRQGISYLKSHLPWMLEEKEQRLSPAMKHEFSNLYADLKALDERVKDYDKQIRQLAKQHECCQRLQAIEGIGPIIATALLALGDVSDMKNGRQFSAFLGLVPRQHSTGGQSRLLGISKKGDNYLRKLLIQGARSVIQQCHKKTDKRSQWLQALVERRGSNKAAVALANRNARVIWHLLVKPTHYCQKWVNNSDYISEKEESVAA